MKTFSSRQDPDPAVIQYGIPPQVVDLLEEVLKHLQIVDQYVTAQHNGTMRGVLLNGIIESNLDRAIEKVTDVFGYVGEVS